MGYRYIGSPNFGPTLGSGPESLDLTVFVRISLRRILTVQAHITGPEDLLWMGRILPRFSTGSDTSRGLSFLILFRRLATCGIVEARMFIASTQSFRHRAVCIYLEPYPAGYYVLSTCTSLRHTYPKGPSSQIQSIFPT